MSDHETNQNLISIPYANVSAVHLLNIRNEMVVFFCHHYDASILPIYDLPDMLKR